MVSTLNMRGKRRKIVRLPGGRRKNVVSDKHPSAPVCAVTGRRLHGVPRLRQAKLRAIPRSQRSPTRPFGGVLSSKAMRDFFRRKARNE